jgi:hypothetical protein
MKTLLRSILVGGLAATAFAVVSNACADEPKTHNSLKRQPKQEEALVFVTGSLVPQRIKVQSIGTKTFSPLRVHDRREIDKTGRFTTGDIVADDPSLTLIGH